MVELKKTTDAVLTDRQKHQELIKYQSKSEKSVAADWDCKYKYCVGNKQYIEENRACLVQIRILKSTI
jgi:hypothetical protein